MALHDHGFRVYAGARTPAWSRFWVISRYALGDALASKKTLVALVASGASLLAFATYVYLHHNAEALLVMQLPVDRLLPVDGRFFLTFVEVQAIFAFFLILMSGSTLVSTDLRDNALPLYLGRPINRFEYVAGKLAVLALLGSAVTWVPGLLLVALQVSFAPVSWLVANWWIAAAVFFGSWVAIAVLAMVCLALSAVLRIKAAIEGAFVAFFLVLLVIGQMLDQLLHVSWGVFLEIPLLLISVWRPLFGLDAKEVSAPAALVALAVLVAGCALVLARRIRAYEVVR